jgi:pyruvate dehydrogenase E2 component (dihydrolipoamide acetyltransferase)
MAIAIKLPDMGTTVDECKVLAWKVKVGDSVKRGDVLADIETDKAVAELESTAEGVLLQCRVPAGTMARTGDVLAYVGRAGESVPGERAGEQEVSTSSAHQTEAPHRPDAGTTPALERHPSSCEEGSFAGSPPGSEPVLSLSKEGAAPKAPGWLQTGVIPGGPPRVSPIVRNLAAKLGVDLGQLTGTGAGGIITREDVQRAHRQAAATSNAPSGAEQLSRMQAAVARAVEKSWREIPHLTIAASIDMERAIELREKSATRGAKVSYDAIFLKAMALACVKHPLFLAKLEGKRIVRSPGVHIALAVSFGDELQLPVIRDVDRKSLASLQAEIGELTATLKARALRADQLSGATMALSNLGMFPIDSFDAIIFPGHSSIITVGSVQTVATVVDGQVALGPRVNVKLAADHRLINGRAAAEFLSAVKQIIEAGNLA